MTRETRESQLQRAILDWLKQKGFVALNLHGHPMQAAGWPDILAWRDGLSFAFELKRPEKELTKLQHHRLNLLENEGVVVRVVRSIDDVRRTVEEL